MTSNALGQSNTNRAVTYDGANKGNMQLFDTNTCAAMPTGLAQIWTDARNNNVYRIKKMLDGKCWMIDNLAYAGDGNDFYGDTHTFSFSTACGTSAWNTSPVSTCLGPTDWPATVNARRATTNNFTGGNLTDRIGNTIQNAAGSLGTDGGIQCTGSPTGENANMTAKCLSYLYSWCVAIGLTNATSPVCSTVSEVSYGSGLVESASSGPKLGIVGKPGGIGGESKGNSNAANQAGVATTNGSICPAGWRLPVGRVGVSPNHTDAYNEFAILSGAMYTVGQNLSPDTTFSSGRNSNWWPAGSFSAVGSGVFNSATGLLGQSTYGRYWSSSLAASTSAAELYTHNVSVYPGTDNQSKERGLAVRCVL